MGNISKINGSLINADTASFVTTAQTASYVENAQTASFVTTAQTASCRKCSNSICKHT
jgi:hypothetical protein